MAASQGQEAQVARRSCIHGLPDELLRRILTCLNACDTVTSLQVCRRWRALLRQRSVRSAHLDVCWNLNRLASPAAGNKAAFEGAEVPAVRWLGSYAHLLARVRVKGEVGALGYYSETHNSTYQKVARLLAVQLPVLLGALSGLQPDAAPPVPVQLELTSHSPFRYEGPSRTWWSAAFFRAAARGITSLQLCEVRDALRTEEMTAICQLTSLQVLILAVDKFSSRLLVEPLPGMLSQLTLLTQLRLHGDDKDKWPLDCISTMHRLQELTVTCHQALVEQPAALSGLTQLTCLGCDHSEGNFVQAVTAHSSALCRLRAYRCASPDVMPALATLRGLQMLDIYGGSLPDLEPFLAANTALQELRLELCNLEHLPRNLASATALRTLQLGRQQPGAAGPLAESFDWSVLLRMPALRSVQLSTVLTGQDALIAFKVGALNAAHRMAHPELGPDAALASIVAF